MPTNIEQQQPQQVIPERRSNFSQPAILPNLLPVWGSDIASIGLETNNQLLTTYGIRYSMTGFHETNILGGMIMIIILSIALFGLVWRLFSIGWKLRV